MFNIGEKIREQLLIRKMSVAEFARLINADRNNAYHIFKRKSIDTELLFKISVILNYDFFQHFQPLSEFGRGVIDDFSMPDREWFSKQFDLVFEKLDQIR